MTSISRQLNLPYSVAQMYALVNDVAAYPQFLPWCEQAIVHHQDAHSMQASIVVGWKGVQNTLTTQNRLVENQSINMELKQGLLKKLSGQWQFTPSAQGCQITLSLEMEFKSLFTAILFKTIMEQAIDKVTAAFCDRAKVLYG